MITAGETPARSRRVAVSEMVRQQMTQPEERNRLYRFCRRLTGDAEVAEDLTQEALIEAWRQADTIQNPTVWRSWLHGIARNMYLRWHRSHGREMARRLNPSDSSVTALLESRPDDSPDFTAALERWEMARLLGRALGKLPAPTRQALTLFYVDEMPHQEIADRLGVSENAAAVRLHRGKQSLRQVLHGDLRAEAAAYGLLPPAPADPMIGGTVGRGLGRETHLWCPFCGKAKLLAERFGNKDRFACRNCMFVLGPRVVNFPSDCIFAHKDFNSSALTEGVHGFKPAFNRMAAHFQKYLADGTARGHVRCLGCGVPLPLRSQRPAHLMPVRFPGLNTHCEKCRGIHVILPSALAFMAPEAQAFWKRHPRMRLSPLKAIPGTDSYVLGFESVTDQARLELVYNGLDYRLIEARLTG